MVPIAPHTEVRHKARDTQDDASKHNNIGTGVMNCETRVLIVMDSPQIFFTRDCMHRLSLSTLSIRDTLHHRYVTVKDVVRVARRVPDMCTHRSYLDCITDHYWITTMSKEIARVTRDDRLADPDQLVDVACELHPEWCTVDDDSLDGRR